MVIKISKKQYLVKASPGLWNILPTNRYNECEIFGTWTWSNGKSSFVEFLAWGNQWWWLGRQNSRLSVVMSVLMLVRNWHDGVVGFAIGANWWQLGGFEWIQPSLCWSDCVCWWNWLGLPRLSCFVCWFNCEIWITHLFILHRTKHIKVFLEHFQ